MQVWRLFCCVDTNNCSNVTFESAAVVLDTKSLQSAPGNCISRLKWLPLLAWKTIEIWVLTFEKHMTFWLILHPINLATKLFFKPKPILLKSLLSGFFNSVTYMMCQEILNCFITKEISLCKKNNNRHCIDMSGISINSSHFTYHAQCHIEKRIIPLLLQ